LESQKEEEGKTLKLTWSKGKRLPVERWFCSESEEQIIVTAILIEVADVAKGEW